MDVSALTTELTASSSTQEITTQAVLAEPTNITYKGGDDDTIIMSWNAVSGATGYSVTLKEAYSSSPQTIIMNVTGTTATFEGLSINKYYSFSMYAYSGAVKSTVAIYYPKLLTRKTITIARLGSWAPYGLAVLWNNSPSSLAEVCISKYATSGYTCYYSDGIHGTDYSYTFFGYNYVTYNTTYYVKIRSFYYEEASNARIFGKYSPVVSGRTILETPKVTVSNTGPTSLKIYWPNMDFASKNYVYRSTSQDGVYSLVFTSSTTTTTFNDTNLDVGQEYFYKVRTYNSTTGEYSAYSDVVSAVTEFIPPTWKETIDISLSQMKVVFNPSGAATGYEIKYYVDDPLISEPTPITMDVSVPELIIDGLEFGDRVTLEVRAYRMVNSTRVYSERSTMMYLRHLPVIPILKKDTSTYQSITVGWEPIEGIDGVELYWMNASRSTSWKLLTDTQNSSYLHANLVTGETIYYQAKSYKNVNGEKLYSDFSDHLSLTPRLDPVKPVITSFSPSSISLAWDAVDGANGYAIYQSTKPTGADYVLVTSTTDLRYVITRLSPNTTYYYILVAYLNESEISRIYMGAVFHQVAGKTIPQTPECTATFSNYNTNFVSWKPVAEASGYEVYLSIGSSTSYTLLRSVTSTSTLHTGLVTGNQYNYKVRAYKIVNLVKIYSTFSTPVSSSPLPTVPVAGAVSSGTDMIKVSWPSVLGASGYEVIYSDQVEGTYTTLPQITSTSMTLNALTPNQPYYFKVRAYRLVGTTKHYSAFSEVVTATPIPSTPVITAVSGGFDRIHLNWPLVHGATGYELYVYEASNGGYVLLSDLSSNEFDDRDLIPGDIRTYMVKAYVLVDDVKVYSLDSQSVNARPIPDPVTGFQVATSKYNELTLTWNAVVGATGYEITRSTSATGVFVAIADVGEGLSATDGALAFNTVYYYKIRSYTMVNDVKVYGNLSAAVYRKTTLEMVPNPGVAYTSYNTNVVTWGAVDGATGYEVYRSTGTSATYALVASVKTLSYTNTSLYTNTRYNYKIRAYRLVGTVKVYGAFSAIVSATPLPWAPSASVSSAGYNALKVVWPGVAGANGYEVSYSTSENGVYTKLALITTTSVTIPNLLTNTTYYVKVRAYRTVSYVKIYGAYSTIITGTPIPATPVVTAVSANYDSVKLSWVAIAGANGYEVYAKSLESSEYFLVEDTPALTSTVMRLMTGSPYQFIVKAYRWVNEAKVYSTESVVKSATPIPASVNGFKVAMPSITSLKLSWTAVSGATGYEVFKSTTLTGTYVSIGLVESSNEYTVTGLTFNTSSYYKIRAYTTVGDSKVYGLISTAITAKTMPSTVQLVATNVAYNTNTLTWPSIEGASGYEIYVSTGTSTYYTLLKSLTATTYTHTALAFNTQYNYKIRAYRLVGTVKVYGAYSTVMSVKTAVSAPSAIVGVTHDSIQLTWGAVAGASGYEVSLATSLTGPYTVSLQTTVSKSYAGLSTGTTYYIKLRSYRLVSTTKVYGPYSDVLVVTPKLDVPTLQLSSITNSTVSFTWSAVPGASDYEVRIRNTAEGSEWVVESVDALTVTFSDLDPSVEYIAQIRAIKKINEIPVGSEYSEAIYFTPVESA